jgi:hypothetical protein
MLLPVAALLCLPPTATAAQTIDAPEMTFEIGTAGELGATFKRAGGFWDQVGVTVGFPTAGNPVNVRGRVVRPGEYVPVAQGPVTGTGTAADPFAVRTTYRAADATGAPVLEIVQTVSHVSGVGRLRLAASVRNISATALRFRVSVLGALSRHETSGVGVLSPGPPRYVGSADLNGLGTAGGIEEITPWSHFQEGGYDDILDIASNPDGPGFDDTIESRDTSFAASGVQFFSHYSEAGGIDDQHVVLDAQGLARYCIVGIGAGEEFVDAKIDPAGESLREVAS